VKRRMVELLHRTGKKYRIVDIPIKDGKEGFLVEFQLQKMIDDIDRLREPKQIYSLIKYMNQNEI